MISNDNLIIGLGLLLTLGTLIYLVLKFSPHKQFFQNNTGASINALDDADLIIIQQSTDYQDLKQTVDKTERNAAKYPNVADFRRELQQAEKNLVDFIEGIRKLRTEIDKIPLNNKRRKKAKVYFEQGDYQAARDVLDEKEMSGEKQVLLRKKMLLNKPEEEIKTQLDDLAIDYIVKAKLTALAYQLGDERIPQTKQYFEEALELDKTPERLFEYALFLQQNNQFLELEKLYEETLTICRELAKANPAVYQPYVATTLNNLGMLIQAHSERHIEAEILYQEALTIHRELAKANPAVYLSEVAMTLNNLGFLFTDDSGRHDKVEKLYEEALTICRELAKANPTMYLPYVANTLGVFGYTYLNWRQPKKAVPYLKEATEIFALFAAQAPKVFKGKLEFTQLLLLLANVTK